MANFPGSLYIPVTWGDDRYRVSKADGVVEYFICYQEGYPAWIQIGGKLAESIQIKAGWTEEEDGWRPTWWFGRVAP